MSIESEVIEATADCTMESLQSTLTTEFINDYYALSEEPLNLRAVGQPWFEKAYDDECSGAHSVGLVLGGTPWLGGFLKRRVDHVLLVDINPGMLDTAEAEIESEKDGGKGKVHYICANWLSLPEFQFPIDLVLGENCLNFLQYPKGWSHLFDSLMPKLTDRAKLVMRFMAIPATHRQLSVDEIVAKYLNADSVVYTQIRAHLLLSHWRPDLKAIPTEQVVRVFDAQESKFEPIFRKFPNPHNDLVTIRKFRNSGYSMHAPPLEEILEFLSGYFRIAAIHYGPFGLSEYFPLIIGARR